MKVGAILGAGFFCQPDRNPDTSYRENRTKTVRERRERR
jgi:hypothetical protein